MLYSTLQMTPVIIAEARRAAATGPGKRIRTRGITIAVVALAILVSACGGSSGPISSPVTEEQAVEMAESALEAFSTGNYATWSEHRSPATKGAIGEDDFFGFREQFQGALGDYVSISYVTGAEGKDRGTYRWTFDIEFEKGDYRMWFGFKEGSALIEGVSFEEATA